MQHQDLASIVLTVEPRPDSICAAAAQLLAALAAPAAGGDDELPEQAIFFVEEVYRIVLNWMATGEEQSLRELIGELRTVVADRGRGSEDLEALPPAAQLATRLGCVLELGAVYLRTDNLARSLGALSGQRRAGWRRALQWIYRQDRPVRAGELRAAGLFEADNSANFALNRLAETGLLVKVREGPKKVVFDLTWAGRSVCRVLGPVAEPPVPAAREEAEEKRPDRLGIPNAEGFSLEGMGGEADRDALVAAFINNNWFRPGPEVRP